MTGTGVDAVSFITSVVEEVVLTGLPSGYIM